jgi:hypothetical protein
MYLHVYSNSFCTYLTGVVYGKVYYETDHSVADNYDFDRLTDQWWVYALLLFTDDVPRASRNLHLPSWFFFSFFSLSICKRNIDKALFSESSQRPQESQDNSRQVSDGGGGGSNDIIGSWRSGHKLMAHGHNFSLYLSANAISIKLSFPNRRRDH